MQDIGDGVLLFPIAPVALNASRGIGRIPEPDRIIQGACKNKSTVRGVLYVRPVAGT